MARLTARINLLERIYGGHQFGHWAEQFGDGRAIMLSETINAVGGRWEFHLKDVARHRVRAAPTPRRSPELPHPY